MREFNSKVCMLVRLRPTQNFVVGRKARLLKLALLDFYFSTWKLE